MFRRKKTPLFALKVGDRVKAKTKDDLVIGNLIGMNIYSCHSESRTVDICYVGVKTDDGHLHEVAEVNCVQVLS